MKKQKIKSQDYLKEESKAIAHEDKVRNGRALPPPAHSMVVQPKLRVGSAHDPAEKEADDLAQKVVQDMETAAPLPEGPGHSLPQPESSEKVPITDSINKRVQRSGGGSGDMPAPPRIESSIHDAKSGGKPLDPNIKAPMEQSFGADFNQVRVHTGNTSEQLNQQMGSSAFTTGKDVFFRKNAYQPSSPSGKELIAHELTHTLQQGAVVRRKLAGSKDALIELGSDASKKSKAKAFGSRLGEKVGLSSTKEGSGKYANILSKLGDYEALEASYLKKTNKNLLPKEAAALYNLLRELDELVVSWLGQNENLQQDETEAKDKVLKTGDAFKLMEDETPDQQRYHALKILLPRIRHEMMEIETGQFFNTEVWADQSLNKGDSQDNAMGGAVNRLDKVVHGDKEGVFLQDKPWVDDLTVGSAMGIPAVDSNPGARSVAMYQLAKLLKFDISVIAKTEFATHTSATKSKDENLPASRAKFGVRMEMVGGKEAAQTPATLTAPEATHKGNDTISLQDPTLQRALNALQLIDAIAGQLDRHWHNYYIITDGQGKVTSVLGIDLDMSFAADHKTVNSQLVDKEGKELKGDHFMGMPQLVDHGFAKAISEVNIVEFGILLSNYLSPSEVKSATDRFILVRDACNKLLHSDNTIKVWNDDTAQQQMTQEKESYIWQMSSGLIKHQFEDTGKAAIKELLKGKGVDFYYDKIFYDHFTPGYIEAIKSGEVGIDPARNSMVEAVRLALETEDFKQLKTKLDKPEFEAVREDTKDEIRLLLLAGIQRAFQQMKPQPVDLN